jgi:hypothetical protein
MTPYRRIRTCPPCAVGTRRLTKRFGRRRSSTSNMPTESENTTTSQRTRTSCTTVFRRFPPASGRRSMRRSNGIKRASVRRAAGRPSCRVAPPSRGERRLRPRAGRIPLYARWRAHSGCFFSCSPSRSKILAMRSGAKPICANPGPTLATSRYSAILPSRKLMIDTPSKPTRRP